MATTYHWQDTDQVVTGAQPLTAGGGSLRIVRSGWCAPYTGVVPMVADLLGGYRLVGAGPFRRIVLIPPMRHPLFTWCRATDVQIEPFEAMSYSSGTVVNNIAGLRRISLPRKKNFGAEGKAKVQITYQLPTLDDDTIENNGEGNNADQNIAIASESWDFTGRSLTVPGRFYQWQHSGLINPTQINDNLIQYSFPEVSYQLVRHRCLRIPFNVVSTLMNSVNANPFTIRTGSTSVTFPAETLLFLGLAAVRNLTTAQGFKFYEITLRFKIRPTVAYVSIGEGQASTKKQYVGWNRVRNFYRTGPGGTPLWERWSPSLYETDESFKTFLIESKFLPDDTGMPASFNFPTGFKALFDPRAL